MDPKTGQIFENIELAEALRRELIPLTPEQHEHLKPLTPAQRIDWAKDWEETQRRLKLHPAAQRPGETEDDARKIRNARKRLRRLAKGKK